MSDVDDLGDDSTDGAGATSAPKALRDQNSQLARENAELKERLAKLEVKERTSTIADVLREKQANARLAKYIARDLEGQDVTADAVDKWLQEEGELFGYTPPSDDQQDADTDAQQRISAATTNAAPPATGWTPERMRSATLAELKQAGFLND